ncbi:hypothetical protein K474DRAFT_1591189 [Panus rudis PR-1116 ss-1]|nr:hypothetical protein K474DRAFT_1591189 [Panus rudis PR-1116 ss-1]
MARPAHETKHLRVLAYPFRTFSFHLAQLDNGRTNGSALWLGAQILSSFLAQTHTRRKAVADAEHDEQPRPRVVELGSGMGLSALALAALGWDVLATDLPDVISSVLAENIARNIANLPGTVQVRILNWAISPSKWVWDNDGSLLGPPFDMIISADTLYDIALVDPLLRAIHTLCTLSLSSSGRAPCAYICLERRDPVLIDHALAAAESTWNFTTERIPRRKVAKAMEKEGLRWTAEDWEGIEIWKLTLRSNPKTT